MPRWEGFAYAAAASIGHSCIDTGRKIASQRLSSAELVGLVGIFDALFLSAFVIGSGRLSSLKFIGKDLVTILVSSSVLKILCAFMYQRALKVSPLSVTVPFLAFTPALIIFTSYVMLGELPNFQGLAGVLVVTSGGYFLALESAKLQSSKKSKLTPIFPLSPPPENIKHAEVVSKSPFESALQSRIVEAGPPAAVSKIRSSKDKSFTKEMQVGVDAKYETEVKHVDVGLSSPSSANLTSIDSELEEVIKSRIKSVDDLEAPAPESRAVAADRVAGAAGDRAVLALSRPKQVSQKGLASDAQEDTNLRFRVSPKPPDKGLFGSLSQRQWRKGSPGAFFRHLWKRAERLSEPLMVLRREEGAGLMLGCAALLSLTNNLDKMGSHLSPSVLVFASLQRVVMAGPPAVFLLYTSPRSFFSLVRYCHILASISFFEIVAIVGYLKSLEYILVSYSVATKRTNILLSVLVGNLIFKEDIWKRLPYILLMMSGMTMIVFA